MRHSRIVRKRSNERPNSEGMTLSPSNLTPAPSFVRSRTRMNGIVAVKKNQRVSIDGGSALRSTLKDVIF
jgi:hypothetical protein